MLSGPLPSEVRRVVLEKFRQLGESPECLCDVEEEVLIAVRGHATRTYRTGKLMAMWMVEVGFVQFYDTDGNILAAINLFEDPSLQREAA